MQSKSNSPFAARRRAGVVLALAALAGAPSIGIAAPVTLSGTNFDIVYDDSLLVSSLYDSPVMLGNTVVFTPVQLYAMSLDGEGLVSVASSFAFRIEPKNGFRIDSVLLTERGDYELYGQQSYVGLDGFASVTDALQPSVTTSGTLGFSSGPNSPVADSGTIQNWSASLLLDLGALPEFNDTTAVDFHVSNELNAYTGAETFEGEARLGFIQKKFSGETITLTVATIPEPTQIALLLAGLGLLGARAQRRASQR